MIISWNTDPSNGNFVETEGKYSSYYQYDTVSRKLVRIRLELGRKEEGGDTAVIYDENRAVGFSTIDFVEEGEEKYPDTDFTIDPETKQLMFREQPMDTVPKDGDYVIDMSEGETEPHFGTRVIQDAHLPEGIQNKHLSVLANEAVIEGGGMTLTRADVLRSELAIVIREQVARIVGVPFDDITDDDLLRTVQKQYEQIKAIESQAPKQSLDASLNDVEKLLEDVRTAMEAGFAPTNEFEIAIKNLNEKVRAAKTAASTGSGIKDAIEDLSKARADLEVVVANQDSGSHDYLKEQIKQSVKAVEIAQAESETWEHINSEYRGIEEATTIGEYERSIGIEEMEAS